MMIIKTNWHKPKYWCIWLWLSVIELLLKVKSNKSNNVMWWTSTLCLVSKWRAQVPIPEQHRGSSLFISGRTIVELLSCAPSFVLLNSAGCLVRRCRSMLVVAPYSGLARLSEQSKQRTDPDSTSWKKAQAELLFRTMAGTRNGSDTTTAKNYL